MRKDTEKIEICEIFLQKQVQKIPFYVTINKVIFRRK